MDSTVATEALLLLLLLLIFGFLVIQVIFRIEHPNALFWEWLKCSVTSGGHLPVRAHFDGRDGYRCVFCLDALHPNDLPEVSPSRHTYVRENGVLTRGEPLQQPSQLPRSQKYPTRQTIH